MKLAITALAGEVVSYPSDLSRVRVEACDVVCRNQTAGPVSDALLFTLCLLFFCWAFLFHFFYLADRETKFASSEQQ